jgi:acyl-CoA synthetase (AMP-forming)/AMP-acid ligase II
VNVSALLAVNGRKYADKPALIMGGRHVTFSQWNDAANLWACRLRERGVSQGDRVVLLMPNCPEFAIMYMAVMRCGGIVVPINARSAQEEVLYILEHSGAKGLVVHDMLLPGVRELPAKHPSLVTVKTGGSEPGWIGIEDWQTGDLPEEMKALSIDPDLPDAHEDSEASMLYTSGTTGRPKGVLFTHRSLLTIANMISIELSITHRSRILQLMPLSHSAPLHLFFIPSIMNGATQVLAPAFSPELLLQLVQEQRITHFFGAPVAYLLTMKHPDFHRYDLSSVRYWMYGGAPLSKDMARQMETYFGREKLACLYGLTEAGPTGTCLMHGEHPDKAGSVGNRAVLFAEVDVVDESGQPVGRGCTGEIRIRGEGAMKGYYNNPEATAEALREGWVYTGDIGRWDEDGFLWIIDRKKDVIISGGVNIYPKELEQELERHPAIQEAAVVGVPHPEWGETIKAYLVLKPGTDPDQDWVQEVRHFLQGRVADFKLPRLAECLDTLPRNASGKILKHILRELRSRKGANQP